MNIHDEFIKITEQASLDKDTQHKTTVSVQHFMHSLAWAKKQYAKLDLAKERAAYLKWKSLENLDKLLIEFEANITRKGGKVIWASDAQAALEEINQIIKKRDAKTVLKSKSTVTEEIGLNQHLRKQGIEVLETDLGEYLIDKFNERSFHPITPAMHKSKAEIAQLLNTVISSSLEADAAELSEDVRTELREKYRHADMAITGANFLIADSGYVSLVENEGNIRLCTTFANTHIVIAGIERVLPTLNDIDLFLPMLATYGTGQQLTAYNTIIGPRQADDTEGAKEFIVLLLDNGRSNVLAQPEQRQALSCIKCGACTTICPVFQTIGGQSYGTSYIGPIGSVTTPLSQGMEEYKHLSAASSLCGACTDVCPVKIDLHNHLLRNRRDAVGLSLNKNSEKLMWFSWKKIILSRKNMNKGNSIKQFMLNSFFKSAWGNQREFPKLADKSFNQLWRERFGA
jgi:L-lactate dehydrogenase complex protein LldF